MSSLVVNRRGVVPASVILANILASGIPDAAGDPTPGLGACADGRTGTPNGYKAHIRAGQYPCTPCVDAERAYDRKRKGREPRRTPQCGTKQGCEQHYRRGEKPCFPCRLAANLYRADLKARKAAGTAVAS